MKQVKRKITAVILLIFVILSTTLVGIAQAASYRGSKPPKIVDFEVTIQQWPDFEFNAKPPTKNYLTDEGDMVIKNFRLHGIPPLIDGVPTSLDEAPDGGIRLTMNDGEYTLIGTFVKNVKINIWYGYDPLPVEGIYQVNKWSFEITEVESGTAPENAVGSTMSGWYLFDTPNGIPPTYTSTKGTGMFHGAHMTFATTLNAVWVEGVIFSIETAEGDMYFP